MKLIPNLLSAARLVMAPFLFWLLWQRQYEISFALCFIAGMTDALDGWLARKLGAASRFGAYLDPISDKIFLGGAFLTLALSGVLDLWFPILVLARDVLILAFVAVAFTFTSIRDFPPSIWGKWSTAVQIAFMAALLGYFVGWFGYGLVVVLKWITAALTAWSALHYAWLGRAMWKRE
jgi:cardiolipin synthase